MGLNLVNGRGGGRHWNALISYKLLHSESFVIWCIGLMLNAEHNFGLFFLTCFRCLVRTSK
jgi:hypothetical protein